VGQTRRQFPDENVKFVEVSKKCPANENGLKWIKMDSNFQKYGFMNVKMNPFQS